jgi:hypothetical protein
MAFEGVPEGRRENRRRGPAPGQAGSGGQAVRRGLKTEGRLPGGLAVVDK